MARKAQMRRMARLQLAVLLLLLGLLLVPASLLRCQPALCLVTMWCWMWLTARAGPARQAAAAAAHLSRAVMDHCHPGAQQHPNNW